jgi:hypothetical protein
MEIARRNSERMVMSLYIGVGILDIVIRWVWWRFHWPMGGCILLVIRWLQSYYKHKGQLLGLWTVTLFGSRSPNICFTRHICNIETSKYFNKKLHPTRRTSIMLQEAAICVSCKLTGCFFLWRDSNGEMTEETRTKRDWSRANKKLYRTEKQKRIFCME